MWDCLFPFSSFSYNKFLQITFLSFQLSIDNVAMSTRIESGGTRYLDLSDSFYLGGIETEKRQRAFSKGIKAADSSIMVSTYIEYLFVYLKK